MPLSQCCGAPRLPRFVTTLLPFVTTSTYYAGCRRITRVSLVSNGFASMVTLPSTPGPTPLLARLVTLPASQLVVRRFSFVYRNRDGRWLIVDHHSSAVPLPPK